MKTDAIEQLIGVSKVAYDEDVSAEALAELDTLEAENAAMRETTIAECKAAVATALINGESPLDALCALTPDSGKVLVNTPTLMLLRDTIQELLDVQNGCPLPKYQEMFDAANVQADEMLGWLAALLKDRP